ncbi:MAG: hypothetical protein AAGA19_12685 [Pseudomonadota bacterium]
MPENVGPVPWFNMIAGTCLLLMGATAAVPVGIALSYDGLASITDWPALFNWLSAFAAVLVVLGLYLLLTPQRVGGWVNFRKGGFSIHIRNFFLKSQDVHVDWSDVHHIELVQGSRQQDGLGLTLTHGATISFRTGYFEIGGEEIVARLSASAEAANYRLEQTRGFNALLIKKQSWHVLPNP